MNCAFLEEARALNASSLNFREQAARFPDQLMQLAPLGKGFGCVQSVLQGILITARRT